MNKKEVKKTPTLRFKGFTNDWEQRKLGEIAKVIGGGTPSTKNSDYWNGNINWYSPTEIGKSNYIFTSKKKITKLGLENSSAKILPGKHTILFTSRAGIGNMAIMQTDGCTNQGFQSWVIDNNTNIYFLYSLGSDLKKEAIRKASGSTFLEISNKEVKKIPLSIPSKHEQDKLGKLFLVLDNLLSLQQRKLELLSIIKKTIIKHLFKLKNSDSLNLKFKTSCSQWNSKKLGEIAKFINGRAFKQSELLNKGKYPVLRVGNFYTNDKWFYSDLNLNKNKYADKGDLLYTWSATFGPHIWKGPKVIFHYHIWKIDFDPSTVNKTFLFYFLEADKENLLTNSNGSTMIHITKSNMENKIINLPQFSIQQNIGTFLSNLDYLINQVKIKSKQLIQLKRFLLQNMFI